VHTKHVRVSVRAFVHICMRMRVCARVRVRVRAQVRVSYEKMSCFCRHTVPQRPAALSLREPAIHRMTFPCAFWQGEVPLKGRGGEGGS